MTKTIIVNYYMFNIYIKDGYLYGDSNSSAYWEQYKVKLPDGVWDYTGNAKQSNMNGKRFTQITIKLNTSETRDKLLNEILNEESTK